MRLADRTFRSVVLPALEVVPTAVAEKLVTFEFSHFMSPNSIYPAAHGLYERYREWQRL